MAVDSTLNGDGNAAAAQFLAHATDSFIHIICPIIICVLAP